MWMSSPIKINLFSVVSLILYLFLANLKLFNFQCVSKSSLLLYHFNDSFPPYKVFWQLVPCCLLVLHKLRESCLHFLSTSILKVLTNAFFYHSGETMDLLAVYSLETCIPAWAYCTISVVNITKLYIVMSLFQDYNNKASAFFFFTSQLKFVEHDFFIIMLPYSSWQAVYI